MNPGERCFRKPLKVLQVYRQVVTYTKQERSFSQRRERTAWPAFSSKSGFIKEGRLYLPEAVENTTRLPSCDLLTIEDVHQAGNGGHETGAANHCYALHHPARPFIFELRNNNELELHLRYEHNEIGIPKRKNFQLGLLKKNQPLAISINGKTDFSLTGRRERVFREQHFVLEYMGMFERYMLLKEPVQPVVKQVIYTKLVDLMKPLW